MAVFLLSAALLVAVGISFVGFAAYIYSEGDDPGIFPFTLFVVILGLASAGTGVFGGLDRPTAVVVWLIQCLEVSAIAWFFFALLYTGRDWLVTRQTFAAVVGVYLVLWLPAALGVVGVVVSADLLLLVNLFSVLYGLSLALVAVTLILQTTYVHGFLSVWVGILLGVVALDPWFVALAGVVFMDGSLTLTLAWYAIGFTGYWFILVATVVWLEALGGTAATLTLGRQAFLSKTEALGFVVDCEERIVEANEASQRHFDLTGMGQQLSAVLGEDVDSLESKSTIQLQTTAGLRQFDLEVIELATRNRVVGHLVLFRDVSERQQREQGLDVLNRILRHNIRNTLSVVVSRMELLERQVTNGDLDPQLNPIYNSIDALEAVSHESGRIELALDPSVDLSPVDVKALITQVARDVVDDQPAGTISIEGEEVRMLIRGPLLELALENALENALEHSTAVEPTATVTIEDTEDGAIIRIDDNGPGIPETEIHAIQQGKETEMTHASGIGLWLIQWATRSSGGTVTFGEGPEGGRIELWIPERKLEEQPPT